MPTPSRAVSSRPFSTPFASSPVKDGESGCVAHNLEQFSTLLVRLAKGKELLARMGRAAREQALRWSWDCVFDAVYDAYESQLGLGVEPSQAETGPASNPHLLTLP